MWRSKCLLVKNLFDDVMVILMSMLCAFGGEALDLSDFPNRSFRPGFHFSINAKNANEFL